VQVVVCILHRSDGCPLASERGNEEFLHLCEFAFVKTHTNSERAQMEQLINLESFLRSQIRGQDHVIERICSALQRAELGLCKAGRPKGSFMFLGPTGVGKTETTIAFTSYILGGEALERFDMSEYQMQDRLGGLVESIAHVLRRTARGTLLFDEIEKAHHRMFDLFLQILDAARLTTPDGVVLDLSGFYMVFTLNIASAEMLDLEHSTFATMERHVLAKAQQQMRPELYASVSEKLVFAKLDYEVQLQIAAGFLDEEIPFLGSRGYRLDVASDVLPFLVRKGFHAKLGAHPMRDAVERHFGEAVVRDLLGGGNGCGRLTAEFGEDRLWVEQKSGMDPSEFRTRGDTC
jgi:ATP-dependent Clp protease ATP-binding subunit ClpB